MGNSQAVGYDPTIEGELVSNEEEYALYRMPTGHHYQKHVLRLPSTPHTIQSYNLRIRQSRPQLVQAVYAGPPQTKINCTTASKYTVVVEHIPTRLSEMSSLRPLNGIILLRSALRGYQHLSRVHGIFAVSEQMIGVNQQQEAKVWINPNFASNAPVSGSEGVQQELLEREMVNNIIDLISSKTAQAPLWTELMHRREQRIPTTFDEALLLVENYINIKNLKITSMVEPYSVIFEDKNMTTEADSYRPSVPPATFQTLPPAIPVTNVPRIALPEPALPISQPVASTIPVTPFVTSPSVGITDLVPPQAPTINFSNTVSQPSYHHQSTPIPPLDPKIQQSTFNIPQFKFEPFPSLPSFSASQQANNSPIVSPPNINTNNQNPSLPPSALNNVPSSIPTLPKFNIPTSFSPTPANNSLNKEPTTPNAVDTPRSEAKAEEIVEASVESKNKKVSFELSPSPEKDQSVKNSQQIQTKPKEDIHQVRFVDSLEQEPTVNKSIVVNESISQVLPPPLSEQSIQQSESSLHPSHIREAEVRVIPAQKSNDVVPSATPLPTEQQFSRDSRTAIMELDQHKIRDNSQYRIPNGHQPESETSVRGTDKQFSSSLFNQLPKEKGGTSIEKLGGAVSTSLPSFRRKREPFISYKEMRSMLNSQFATK